MSFAANPAACAAASPVDNASSVAVPGGSAWRKHMEQVAGTEITLINGAEGAKYAVVPLHFNAIALNRDYPGLAGIGWDQFAPQLTGEPTIGDSFASDSKVVGDYIDGSKHWLEIRRLEGERVYTSFHVRADARPLLTAEKLDEVFSKIPDLTTQGPFPSA